MAITESEVEHGPVIEQRQNENITQKDDSSLAQVESKIPSEVPTDDVVTPKTWLVVFVSLPCHTSAITHT
jgi:hypothetical protein